MRKSFFWKDESPLGRLSKSEMQEVTWGLSKSFFGKEKSTLGLGNEVH
jgi:hypothetical protein